MASSIRKGDILVEKDHSITLATTAFQYVVAVEEGTAILVPATWVPTATLEHGYHIYRTEGEANG